MSCDFIENLENSGACDVSVARTLSYTVTVTLLFESFSSFFVVHWFSTFAVFNPLTSLLALIVSPTVRDNTPHCSFYCLLSFGSLLVTMSSQTSSSWRNRITCFPGDPRYAAMKLTATAAEFSCLSRKEFLSTAVLDSILQHTALPQDNASEEIIPPMIGSLGCDAWMTASNYNASLTRKEVETQAEWKRRQHLVTKLRNKLARIIDVKATPDHPQRLIIPMVSPPGLVGHFLVACFDFSVHHPGFFVDISFYDSLKRAQTRIKQARTCASMVKKVNFFQQIHSARKEVPLYTTVRCRPA